MTQTAATQRSNAQQALGTQVRRRVARGLRVVLIVLVVGAGGYLASGFGKLWGEWGPAIEPAAARRSTTADLNSMGAVLPLAGQWSFAELDWNLRSNMVARDDVAARLEKLAASPAGTSDEQLPDVSQELVEHAENLQIKPVKRGGNEVYRLDRPHLKAQLVVRMVGGRPKVVALAAAYPQRGDEWQLLEFMPRAPAGSSAALSSYLLPLPASARRCGGRFGDDGRALLELISLDANAGELCSMWTDSGWEIRHTGMGGPDNFSYLCARDNEVIYAWSADGRGALQNLMLVRTPTSSNTNP